MKHIFYIILLIFISGSICAQESHFPKRTAKDIALKQTKRMAVELGITTDTIRCERLFHLHLKYANMRNINDTRDDILHRMKQMQEDLKQLLSPEQFTAFINQQLNYKSRTPKHTCNWFSSNHPHSSSDTTHSTSTEEHTPPQPPEHQQ